jgi:CubicO group peptidase (beta-lactamase class C family)
MAARRDFGAIAPAMQRYVDADLLPGASWAVLAGQEVAEIGCVGWADREAKIPLGTEHLFRVFSNTKLITSCAALMLMEEGRFQLDDPAANYLPQLANRRVLRPGATHAEDTEPAARPITIRHLMTHTAGLGYGVLDPGTLMYRLYGEQRVHNPAKTLAEMLDAIGKLPLARHPGSAWEYSIATDVLGRLVEILSGKSLDEFLRERIFAPLGMADTGFVARDKSRLAAYYAGADMNDPMKPGLTRLHDLPYPGAFVTAMPRLSGGGGLVSTLPDMVALVKSLMPGGRMRLRPQTLALMRTNQLAAGDCVRFPRIGEVPGKGHGLAGAVTLKPSAIEPAGSAGEFEWGGIAGTHWWIAPEGKFAGVAMTQRQMGFWHPFAFEFKRLAYQGAR